MRMRYKSWARPELAECEFYVDRPFENIGKWKDAFKRENPIHLELGSGKGTFIAELASSNKNTNYIAIDIKSEVIVCGKRNIEEIYGNKNEEIDNVLIMSQDIERIHEMLSSEDKIERIYINFCNPWPKDRHKKRRLTHTRQLEHYKEFLSTTGEIHFKTDDDELFEESLAYFEEAGFKVDYITYDLHSSDYKNNILTEHEVMFSEQGIKIKFLIASRK